MGGKREKHDMMVDVFGPAVNRLQTEFLDSWEEIAGNIDKERKFLLKDEKTIEREMKKSGLKPKVKTQVLTTNENEHQVYRKIIEEIGKSKKEITIEHAYFRHDGVMDALKKAMRDGVKVNVILPQESDEDGVIHFGNLATIQELKQEAKH